MVNRRRFLLGLGAAVSLAVATRAHAEFLFLKSAKNGTAQVSKSEVKAFYTGKAKTWKSGQDVEIVLNAPGTPEIKWLAEQVVGADEQVLIAKIKQEVFKGDMKRPEMVSTPDACIAALKKTEGGLCVVDAAAAKSLQPGIAILNYSGG
jgi:hypothetical protein